MVTDGLARWIGRAQVTYLDIWVVRLDSGTAALNFRRGVYDQDYSGTNSRRAERVVN